FAGGYPRDVGAVATQQFDLFTQDVTERIVECRAATGVNLIQLPREHIPVCREIRNHLNVIAKTDDRNLVLRTGGAKEVASRLANKVHSLLDTSGNIEQQHQIKWLV